MPVQGLARCCDVVCGLCRFRLEYASWSIRPKKRDGPQVKRGKLAARKEGRNDAFASRSAMGSRQAVERDVSLARLTIATDVGAGVSWEWLWDDALVNGM